MRDDTVSVLLQHAKRAAAIRARGLTYRAKALGASLREPPRRPIFIVGCPRSGTTLLFELLRQHDELRSLSVEGHVLWSVHQHPRHKGWHSDRATERDIRPGEQRYLFSAIREITGGLRFLDKTPKNVLRIRYLAELFPDASVVFVKRDGRDTLNSLIEGWNARRGVSYRLPRKLRLAEYRGRLWSYVLPPGWRDMTHTSIAEVAALQYAAANEAALADRSAFPAGSFVGVAYEDLLARPVDTARSLLDRLELSPSSAVLDVAADLRSHEVGTISAPRPRKWQDRRGEIARVLPSIKPVMTRLGYRVEADAR